MERGEKKKKKEDDAFRWTPEEPENPEDLEPEPDESHVDFISADGPLRLVSVLDEFGDTIEMFYELPPAEAPIWVEWHNRQMAKKAFALVE